MRVSATSNNQFPIDTHKGHIYSIFHRYNVWSVTITQSYDIVLLFRWDDFRPFILYLCILVNSVVAAQCIDGFACFNRP